MLLYYITDRSQFPGDEDARREALLKKVRECASSGVDYIQLREKDLSGRELEKLARLVVAAVRERSRDGRVLINSRIDVAIACGADGVHLRSGDEDPNPGDARAIFASAGAPAPIVAASCHSESEVDLAESHGADFVVCGPAFESSTKRDTGLQELRRSSASVTM